MTKLFFISLLFLVTFSISAQAPYTWKDWYAYNSVSTIEQIDGSIVALTSNGLFLYNTATGSTTKITKIQGLSGVGLTTMKYNASHKKLIVGYDDGCIDILQFPTLQITNIPTISKRAIYGSKAIRDIQFSNDTVFVATDFGLVSLHIQTHEFIHTAVLGSQGESVSIQNITIDTTHAILYAATQKGIYQIGLNQNLSDGSLWKQLPNSIHQSTAITHVCYFNNSLYYSVAHKDWNIRDTVYCLQNSVSTLFDTLSYLEKIKITNEQFTLVGRSGIHMYTNELEKRNQIKPPSIDFQSNFADICINNSEYWIGDNAKGIYSASSFEPTYPQGPYSNLTSEVFFRNSVLYVVSGAAGVYQLGQFNMYSGGFWYGHVNWGVRNSICVYPVAESKTYYYGTYGWGLVQGTVAWKHDTIYNKYNSTIQNTYDDDSPYEIITDIGADTRKNIWCVNRFAENPLVVKTTTNTWNKFNFNEVNEKNIYKNFERLLIDKNNTIWLAGETKLIAFNANNTIDNPDDDTYAYIQLSDDEGNIADKTTCVSLDYDDALWVGTTQGIARLTTPYDVFKGRKSLSRIKIEIDGEVGYLLSSERITCIAVDGANRKWIGTQNSGIFLISPDGTKQIENYTTQQSPLPSNTIQSIAINNTTGEVFIATDKGLVSIMSDATRGEETMEDIKIFPNPVREYYTGNIYIQGTTPNAIIKITDMSGDLVFQTIANGGTGVWNGTNLLGNRVATGVYLVYISNDDGSQTRVSKLMVIH